MNKIMFFRDNIGEPPWNYYLLQNLDEKEYSRYLSKLYKIKTGERLNLKHPKTFNEKLQWLKLYGVTDLMRDCTDKVKVRDYVKERIGEEYLKPVLQIIGACHSENLENQNNNSVDFQVVQNLKEEKSKKSQQSYCHPELVSGSDINNNQKMLKHACIDDDIQSKKINNTAVQHDRPLIDFVPKSTDVSTYFDKINFDKLPNAFVIKTNHGCKWQYVIKNKEEFLKNKRLFDIVKQNITGWLEQEYWCWGGFEMQYRNIEPKLIIEEFLGNEKEIPQETEVYCFNGIPKIFVKVKYGKKREISYYDENFNNIDLIFHNDGKNIIKYEKADCLIKQTFDLSAKLCITNPSPQPSTQYNRCISFTQLEPSLVQLYLSRGEGVLFNFVRVDWLVFNNKLYFNELTFTPYSGFMKFDKKWNLKLGSWMNI